MLLRVSVFSDGFEFSGRRYYRTLLEPTLSKRGGVKNTTFAIRVSATVTNTDRIVKKKREKTKKRQLTPKSVIYDCGSRKFLTTCSSQSRPRRADAHRFSLLAKQLHDFYYPGTSPGD